MDAASLLVALLVGLTVPPSRARAGGELEASPVQDAPLEEVLAALPEVGRERRWDEERETYVLVPAVQRLQRLFEEGVRPTDGQWRQALLGTKAIRARSKWPADEPYAVSLRTPAWLEGNVQIRMEARRTRWRPAMVGFLTRQTSGSFTHGMSAAARYQELGRLRPGRHDLLFDVTVERGHTERWPGAQAFRTPGVEQLWAGTLTVTVDAVRGIDEVLPPVEGDALDAAVRSSVGLAFWATRGVRHAVLVLDPDDAGFRLLAHTALSLEVDVLEGGVVRQTLELAPNGWDPADPATWNEDGSRPPVALRVLDEVPTSLEHDSRARADWSLRIRGTQEHTHYLWDAERTWVGSFRISLAEARAQEMEKGGAGGRRPWEYSRRFLRELGYPWKRKG